MSQRTHVNISLAFSQAVPHVRCSQLLIPSTLLTTVRPLPLSYFCLRCVAVLAMLRCLSRPTAVLLLAGPRPTKRGE
jgi:hypothetical protein